MPSPLSFSSTENLRKKLLVRNLPPFNSDGFSPTTNPGQSELKLTDFSVVDSAEVEVIGDQEEVKLYINNQYGPPGGFDDRYSVQDVQKIVTQRDEYYKFVSSYYNPVSILFSDDPQGSDGTVSQDSVLMQIGAKSLKNEMQYRVAEELRQETLGRFNFLNALQDPFIAADILTGRQELIEPDWTISSPTNIVGKGLDYISRISGVYVPFSWIPGDYFEGKRSFLNEGINVVAGLFGRKKDLLPTRKTGSDIFLNNTGKGQTNTLFKSLEYNRYRPDYKANFLSDPNLFAPGPNYYVGSRTQDPSQMDSPTGNLPVDQDGQQVRTAIYGYSSLGDEYELQELYKFGLGTVEPGNNPDLQGGFTWISSESQSGVNTDLSTWGGTLSTNYEFQPGSILDDTQKLVESADGLSGIKKQQHVGHAINQASRIFNDGTREITKGSRVKTYVNEGGKEVGKEYCRIFTKDNPYYQMSDLQKRNGNIRGFNSSVLSNTYNLNIAPQRSESGKPLNFGTSQGENITKYMLSLENLAWRTSKLQQDLPECEKGPAGGRIMWFPPYDLNVDENITARWNTNDFLGRPEPIYTYANTQRVGSLSFKIIVDHPSVLNTLVKKHLKDATFEGGKDKMTEINKVVDSFFAGCRDLDIYELLRKYGQFSYNDIYEVVTRTNNSETFEKYYQEIPREAPEVESTPPETTSTTPDFTSFEGMDLYYDNNEPEGSGTYNTTSQYNYEKYLNNYISRRSTYVTQAEKWDEGEQVGTFFDDDVTDSLSKLNELITKAVEAANNGYTINITLTSSASSKASAEYNEALSSRRNSSVSKQILDNPKVKEVNAGSKGKITIVNSESLGEATGNCSEPFTGPNAAEKEDYSIQAMKCRTTRISIADPIGPELTEDETVTEGETDNNVYPEDPEIITGIKRKPGDPLNTDNVELKKDITKKLLRRMLSECDYFEALTEDTSFLYENISEKIKYFNPAFHSITPEGLNSRLTFLQQCLRPGETIPTIGPDGNPLENDALNTSFGTPPICILRVGDFWHTKIAINQMSIRYDPLNLDINPEGIGVQPMYADVSLSFNFIGGHGLKEPVKQLQNALSFNYYANTEMYDERAVVTEETTELDENFVAGLDLNTPFGVENVIDENSDDGGSPIGEITQSEVNIDAMTSTSGGTTGGTSSISGTLSYKQIMDDLLDTNEAYKETLPCELENIGNYYGQIGVMLFTKDRKYSDGEINTDASSTLDVKLYGKSEDIDKKFEKQFEEAKKDVDSGNFPLIPNRPSELKNKDLKKYKKKIKEIIDRVQNGYSTEMVNLSEEIYKTELSHIRNLNKMNVVMTKVDGIKNIQGKPVVYPITATTEVYPTPTYTDTYEELKADYNTVGEDLNKFNDNLISNNIIPEDKGSHEYKDNLSMSLFTSTGNIITKYDKRFYLLFNNQILENKTTLQTELEKFVDDNKFENSNSWKTSINAILLIWETILTKEKEEYTKIFVDFHNTPYMQEGPELYTKGKNRNFTFRDNPNASSQDKTKITQLYSGVNEGPNNKWNGKVKLQ